jgi:O-antigen/teichoic acid export membrane protein
MKGPIARGTMRTTFVLGLRLPVQAGTLLLVARMLGPHQFGAFAGVAALAVLLGTLSTFGTHLVLLAEVSKNPARREKVLPYAVPTTLLTGCALLAIYLTVCVLALQDAGVSLRVLLLVGSAELLLQPLITLCASEQQGLGRIAWSQILTTLPMLLRLVAATVVFASDAGNPLDAYAWGYVLASLVALWVVLATLPASWPLPNKWRLPAPAVLQGAAGYAALNITAAGPAELDKTLAAKLLPLEAAGVYAAAARVVGAAIMPINAMTTSALPRLFREGQTRTKSTISLLRWMFGTSFAYGLLIAMALLAAAPLFDLIFGTKYRDIAHVIRWLCLATPGIALRRVAGSILMAVNRPWARFGFEASGLAVLTITSVFATAQLGAIGMPIALCASESVMAALGIFLVAFSWPRQLRPHRFPSSIVQRTRSELGK